MKKIIIKINESIHKNKNMRKKNKIVEGVDPDEDLLGYEHKYGVLDSQGNPMPFAAAVKLLEEIEKIYEEDLGGGMEGMGVPGSAELFKIAGMVVSNYQELKTREGGVTPKNIRLLRFMITGDQYRFLQRAKSWFSRKEFISNVRYGGKGHGELYKNFSLLAQKLFLLFTDVFKRTSPTQQQSSTNIGKSMNEHIFLSLKKFFRK